jgi:hypothetical protein
MPRLAPLGCQMARSSGVAVASDGYQLSGALMTRPSLSHTVSNWSSVLTALTFTPLPFTPCMWQFGSIFASESQRCADFSGFQSFAERNGNVGEPDFHRTRSFVDVHVRRLVALFRVRVEPISANAKECWHRERRQKGRRPQALPLHRSLVQNPLSPPSYTHDVESFSIKNDLLNGLLPVVACMLEPIPHFHPANLTF